MSQELERAELHRALWKIANDLRGSVDGWDFKQYVLGFMFYRFISENLTAYLDSELEEGEPSYATLTNVEIAENPEAIEDTVEEKGFFIFPEDLFENVRQRANHNNDNLNEELQDIFKRIESSASGILSEEDNKIRGLFDDLDVNSNKLGSSIPKRNDLLRKLLNEVGNFKLSSFADSHNDTFGDAYEYLMGMYASSAGKSGGEYYTPQAVSELLAHIAVAGKDKVNKVYDPACGSGGLLLKFAKVLGKENVKEGFFGQEINLTTRNLAVINMFLHDLNYANFDIAHGDTLLDPAHRDIEPFEAIVSNPPYSVKWEGDANPLLINDERFAPAGVLAPKSKADFAFVLHALNYLSAKGRAAIVCFPGIFYRGGAEQKIRQYLVDNNYVETVISLAPNLFFGTTIAVNILVLSKHKTDTKVQFIDASELFKKETNNNILTDAHIEQIMQVFASKEDVAHLAKSVTFEAVVANDYNLSVSSYVESKDNREIIDIAELNAELKTTVSKIDQLRKDIDSIVAEIEGDEVQG